MAAKFRKTGEDEKAPKVGKLSGITDLKGATGYLQKKLDKGMSTAEVHAGLSTGNFMIDGTIGIGGFPIGITELFGNPGSGKTSLSIDACVNCQKVLKEPVGWLDFEHKFPAEVATVRGLDIAMGSPLWAFYQPDHFEQGALIIRALIQGGCRVIVWDSLAAAVPQAELDEDSVGKSQPGLQSRVMSSILKQVTGQCVKAGVHLIFINQLRDVISTTGRKSQTTTCGNAVKYYASLRAEMRAVRMIKGKDFNPNTGIVEEMPLGVRSEFRAVKNSVGKPFRSCQVELGGEVIQLGVNNLVTLIEIAEAKQVIVKSGQYYVMKDRKPQGIVQLQKYLIEHMEETMAIADAIGWDQTYKDSLLLGFTDAA